MIRNVTGALVMNQDPQLHIYDDLENTTGTTGSLSIESPSIALQQQQQVQLSPSSSHNSGSSPSPSSQNPQASQRMAGKFTCLKQTSAQAIQQAMDRQQSASAVYHQTYAFQQDPTTRRHMI